MRTLGKPTFPWPPVHRSLSADHPDTFEPSVDPSLPGNGRWFSISHSVPKSCADPVTAAGPGIHPQRSPDDDGNDSSLRSGTRISNFPVSGFQVARLDPRRQLGWSRPDSVSGTRGTRTGSLHPNWSLQRLLRRSGKCSRPVLFPRLFLLLLQGRTSILLSLLFQSAWEGRNQQSKAKQNKKWIPWKETEKETQNDKKNDI